MIYELVQATLTQAFYFILYAGLTGIALHAIWSWNERETAIYREVPHGTLNSTLITEVDTKVLPPLESSDICLPSPSCPIDPDAHWDESEPDDSAWEYASPLTCEWIAPAVAKTPVTRKPRTRKPAQPQSSLAQELGLTPPLGWGQVQQTATRKTCATKKLA